jgi:hypothetical protein
MQSNLMKSRHNMCPSFWAFGRLPDSYYRAAPLPRRVKEIARTRAAPAISSGTGRVCQISAPPKTTAVLSNSWAALALCRRPSRPSLGGLVWAVPRDCVDGFSMKVRPEDMAASHKGPAPFSPLAWWAVLGVPRDCVDGFSMDVRTSRDMAVQPAIRGRRPSRPSLGGPVWAVPRDCVDADQDHGRRPSHPSLGGLVWAVPRDCVDGFSMDVRTSRDMAASHKGPAPFSPLAWRAVLGGSARMCVRKPRPWQSIKSRS